MFSKFGKMKRNSSFLSRNKNILEEKEEDKEENPQENQENQISIVDEEGYSIAPQTEPCWNHSKDSKDSLNNMQKIEVLMNQPGKTEINDLDLVFAVSSLKETLERKNRYVFKIC